MMSNPVGRADWVLKNNWGHEGEVLKSGTTFSRDGDQQKDRYSSLCWLTPSLGSVDGTFTRKRFPLRLNGYTTEQRLAMLDQKSLTVCLMFHDME